MDQASQASATKIANKLWRMFPREVIERALAQSGTGVLGDWQPREDQKGLWSYLTSGGLRACEVAHRRWG